MNEDTSKIVNINRTVIITVFMNIFLLIIKVVAGLMVNSTALIADGLHSGSDVITSLGVIIGVKMAQKPRDEKHHYGHEKIETMVTFLLSIILIYVGAKIGYGTIIAIIQKRQVHFTCFALFIAFASIVIKEIQYQIAFRVGTKEQSPALIADAWHHRSDAFSSVASFIGILGAKYKIYILDSLAGLAVSIIVIRVGIKIFMDCFQQLIDISICTDEMDNVKKVIISKTDTKNISDMRTRRHGTKVFVDISICVDPDINVQEGHEIAREVENIIKEEIENVKDVIVHVNPFCYK
ncbi:MAG: cation diffusion facilitator family transporter [Candidatus Alkaliphilus sp. MAG34]|jgi:cation diffusion facilitator family transporter|nr:cation transporter [Clostridiales bacterium]